MLSVIFGNTKRLFRTRTNRLNQSVFVQILRQPRRIFAVDFVPFKKIQHSMA